MEIGIEPSKSITSYHIYLYEHTDTYGMYMAYMLGSSPQQSPPGLIHFLNLRSP